MRHTQTRKRGVLAAILAASTLACPLSLAAAAAVPAAAQASGYTTCSATQSTGVRTSGWFPNWGTINIQACVAVDSTTVTAFTRIGVASTSGLQFGPIKLSVNDGYTTKACTYYLARGDRLQATCSGPSRKLVHGRAIARAWAEFDVQDDGYGLLSTSLLSFYPQV